MSSMHTFARDSSSESSEDDGDFADPSADNEEFRDFNPRKRRRTGRDAKESAALGIFGSESEDDGPGKRWKRKTLRSRGVGFVSTGQKKLDDDDDEDEDEDYDEMKDAKDDEEEDVPKSGLGSGFGASRVLGFQPATKDAEKQKPTTGSGLGFGTSRDSGSSASTPNKSKISGFSRGTPLGKGFVPTSAATPILNENLDDETSTPKKVWRSAFDTPTAGHGAKTKTGPMSFGERMMAKHGWEKGKGLGKEGQGRTGIIETQLRPQGAGLGAVREKGKQEKEEEKRQAMLKGEVYEDSDEELRKKKARRPKISGSGGISGVSTPKRVKPKFRTVQEMEKAAPGLKIPDSFASILDMTGPDKKLLTTTSGLMTPTTGSESLEHAESRKLARRAQSDMSAFVEEWKSLQERKAYNELQAFEKRQEIEAAKQGLEQVREFAQAVSTITAFQRSEFNEWGSIYQALLSVTESGNSATDGSSTADVIAAGGAIHNLTQYNEIISNIAISAIHPFLRKCAQSWKPLADPKLGDMVPSLLNIRQVLGVDEARVRIKATTPYETMMHQIIFPKIASAVMQSWNVQDPAPLLTLLDTWKDLLPAFVRAQVIDQAVVAKLNDAVSNWKPRNSRSRELPHLWLFPWLQYLAPHHADPASKNGLVTDVKRKFRQLIDSWDFSKGVIPGLQQWREVLRPNSKKDMWTPLIMNHILPRMAQYLKDPQNFVVDPQDQEPYLKALYGAFAWQDILGAKAVGQVIVETVFPVWHSVLHQWLTGESRNYEEIGQWFQWWSDDVFPEAIKSLKSIQQEFQKGTHMINHALDLGSHAASTLPVPSYMPLRPPLQKSRSPTPTPAATPVPVGISFRDRVEEWCQENDIFFVPERKVMHVQGPLYRITAAGDGKNGGVHVYFKGDRLLVVQKTEDMAIDWENEVAKDALIGMAHHNVR
ncbi:GC-rich sequence DNA-binding factor-like protein-domain-containing protein [Calycina marina]|uniref:GC-rich sequence DNA-binding factor-like protein-domain-containing protein n=1 Tax=Calycina marina TaxID=1763456 RepID=A0A9P7YX05_9HELO|nr:GC-rich sequence DNA-binding factor-like protein-domain-containing protein [Calycina marina]